MAEFSYGGFTIPNLEIDTYTAKVTLTFKRKHTTYTNLKMDQVNDWVNRNLESLQQFLSGKLL
ncbi:MAG: hypothetical protein IPP02_15745 [Chitinophagaceae bacterium]|nr:hypothetical protein [Chitinophagaceae bacterium]